MNLLFMTNDTETETKESNDYLCEVGNNSKQEYSKEKTLELLYPKSYCT